MNLIHEPDLGILKIDLSLLLDRTLEQLTSPPIHDSELTLLEFRRLMKTHLFI